MSKLELVKCRRDGCSNTAEEWQSLCEECQSQGSWCEEHNQFEDLEDFDYIHGLDEDGEDEN